jgi:hypothetical protein
MRNIIKNRKVLSSLPSLTTQGYKHAYLVVEDDKNIPKNNKIQNNPKTTKRIVNQKLNEGVPLFEFLYNPESVSISTPINYQETAIPYTTTPQVNFVSGGAQTLTISDIYLDSYEDKKSLQPILDKLTSLREPTKQNGLLLSPPVLYFKWGEYSSFPCVLTQIDYTITNRINGYPVRARLNLSFKEVPSKTARTTAPQPISTPTNTKNLPKPLTTKQSLDGVTEVLKNGLRGLQNLLPSSVKSLKKADVTIDNHSGDVTVANVNVGTYNGDVFTPNDKKTNKNFSLT